MKFPERNFRLPPANLYVYHQLLAEEGILPVILIPDNEDWYTLKSIGEELIKTLLTHYELTFLKRIESGREVFHFYKDRSNFIYLANFQEAELRYRNKKLNDEIKLDLYKIEFGYFEGGTFYPISLSHIVDKLLKRLSLNNLTDLIMSILLDSTLPEYIV